MKIKLGNIVIIYLLLNLSGYVVVASITSYFNVETRLYSIAIRALIVLSSLCFLVFYVRTKSVARDFVVLGFLVFWFLYALRIAHATMFSDEVLRHDALYYWIWAIGVCALPMIIVLLLSVVNVDPSRFFALFMLSLYLSGVFAVLGGTSMKLNQANDLVATGRLQLESLNPISLGHLGATILILSLWYLFSKHKNTNILVKSIVLFNLFIGGYLLIASNSRGPILAVMVSLTFMLFMSRRHIRVKLIIVLVISLLALPKLSLFLENNYGITTYTRLVEHSNTDDYSIRNRLDRYGSAIGLFKENPVFGTSLEDEGFSGYPHNIFIESFMSTGILGGFLLFSLITVVFYRSIKIYQKYPEYSWVSLIFIQYLLASQFSGSIHSSAQLWISSALVISIWNSFNIHLVYGGSGDYQTPICRS